MRSSTNMADKKSSGGVGVYVEEEEEGGKVSGKPCEGSRRELVNCLKESVCIKQGGTVRECLKNGLTDCNPYHVAFFECRRSLLDNRVRFRGRKGY